MPKLADIAEINPRLDRSAISDMNEVISFVPMANVSEVLGAVVSEESRKASDVIKGFTPFKDRDVLIAKITPCFENGKIAHARIARRLGFGSTEFHVVRPKTEQLDDRYLYHFLRQPVVREAGERRMTGSAGQKRVPKAFFEELNIPLPPIPEQRRIAAILDKADALRAKRREAIAKLDQLLQSVFLEMFGDPVKNPKGWPLETLRQLGKVQTGSTPPSAKSGMFDGETPFATPGDLGGFVSSTRRTLTSDGANESRLATEGSTLVCCIGATIGKMGLATKEVAFNQQINAVSWTAEIDPLYGFCAMTFFAKEIATRGASTTLPILKKSEFEKIKIPVAPKLKQEKFKEFMKNNVAQRQRMEGFAMLTDSMFMSLQSRAFTGEL